MHSNSELLPASELLSGIDVVLLDIEGTTTPITFVTDCLFPYARQEFGNFLEQHAADLEDDLRILGLEHAADVQAGNNPPTINPPLSYILWLMDQDRKSRALKSLQGKIWHAGYKAGVLKGIVYEDVPKALSRWCSAGMRVFIYSSGSVLAQKLLFAHSSANNLLPLIAGHFDTTIGGKKEVGSYKKITEELGTDANRICFFSDVIEELNAAATAGLRTVLVCRDAQPTQPVQHPIVSNFSAL